jgi:glucose dehydrogenase
MRKHLPGICRLLVAILGLLYWNSSVYAADWLTFGHDPQRSGWAFSESKLSLQNVANLELKWKAPVKNEPKSLTALTAPVVATNVTTAQGVKTLVFVAGTSNSVFALDAETGAIIWTRALETVSIPKNEDFWLCPQGINATPVIDRNAGILFVIG